MPTMTRWKLLWIAPFVACLGLFAACGGDDSDGDATATTSSDEATATTAEETPADTPEPDDSSDGSGSDLPRSPLRAPLRGVFSYATNENLEPSDAPEGLQEVFAAWYRGDGRLIVVFEGLDLDATGPVCPGAAAFVEGRLESRTVAPTSAGACDGEPNQQAIAPSDAGVRICDGLVAYVTTIPDDTEGDLYAEINALADGDWWVLHIQVGGDQEPPEIDPAVLTC